MVHTGEHLGIGIGQQAIQARKDEEARQRARARFLAGGGTQVQLDIGEFERQLRQIGFELKRGKINARLERRRQTLVNAIARLKGLPVPFPNVLSLAEFNRQGIENKPVDSDLENRVIDRVASRIERARKLKNKTLPASEIGRIVQVGTGGGEQVSTS